MWPSLTSEAAAQGTDTSQGADPKGWVIAFVDPNGYDPVTGYNNLLGGGNSNIFYVHPYFGEDSQFWLIFSQMGWNHQLDLL